MGHWKENMIIIQANKQTYWVQDIYPKSLNLSINPCFCFVKPFTSKVYHRDVTLSLSSPQNSCAITKPYHKAPHLLHESILSVTELSLNDSGISANPLSNEPR